MFLLDTNVISELRKAADGRADAGVAAWTSSQVTASFYISVLTLMELEFGILRIEKRDARQGIYAAALDEPSCFARICGAHTTD